MSIEITNNNVHLLDDLILDLKDTLTVYENSPMAPDQFVLTKVGEPAVEINKKAAKELIADGITTVRL